MGIYKNLKYYNDYSFTVLPPDTSSSEITRLSSAMSFNFWDIKAIFKPSVLIHYPKFRLGLTATLPSINIIGKGNFYREFSTLNMDDILPFDFAVISRARKSKIKHRGTTSEMLAVPDRRNIFQAEILPDSQRSERGAALSGDHQ